MKRPYELTLTKSERDAIDWVGYRCRHGDDLKTALCDDGEVDGVLNSERSLYEAWNDPNDLTFRLSEPQAWLVHEIMEDDPNFTCFSEDLTFKLLTFCEHIV